MKCWIFYIKIYFNVNYYYIMVNLINYILPSHNLWPVHVFFKLVVTVSILISRIYGYCLYRKSFDYYYKLVHEDMNKRVVFGSKTVK
jgi:hypothetical protein